MRTWSRTASQVCYDSLILVSKLVVAIWVRTRRFLCRLGIVLILCLSIYRQKLLFGELVWIFCIGIGTTIYFWMRLRVIGHIESDLVFSTVQMWYTVVTIFKRCQVLLYTLHSNLCHIDVVRAIRFKWSFSHTIPSLIIYRLLTNNHNRVSFHSWHSTYLDPSSSETFRTLISIVYYLSYCRLYWRVCFLCAILFRKDVTWLILYPMLYFTCLLIWVRV